MKTVFERNYPARTRDPIVVAERVFKYLEKTNDWVSTGELYKILHREVRRDVLHPALKELLKTKRIKMRLITPDVQGGCPRTDFKVIA